jgi:hypothetical protein
MRIWPLIIAALAILSAAGPARAATSAPFAGDCTALARTTLDLPEEATTHITAAEAIAATGERAAYCRVRGYVAPDTVFQIVLPMQGWNGKFFYAGCTGSCGMAGESVWARECDHPFARGYACIISDMGHRSSPADGLWAWRNLEAKVDFAYRATHRTVLAGKALVAAFYGQRPKHSYFMGCSTGGRQALVSAQRFPTDFDGVIAGAPVVSEAGTSMSFVWTLNSLNRADGSPIFDEAALLRLHKGAIAALDAADGRRDGVIDDPRRAFDPATLDLTPEQVEAARRVYAGPVDSNGRPTYFGGGFLPGSEMGWRSFLAIGGPAQATRSGTDTTRYIQSDFGPKWQARDFDFDRDPDRLREHEILYSASNPDLRAFRDAGGKLLIYHGWADARVAPLNSVDYYEAVTRTMGGSKPTRDFARLVMVPGMEHCWGGEGPYAIDYIAAMEAWVEQGQAPEQLRAAHRKTPAAPAPGPSFIQPFPAAAGEEEDVRMLATWTVAAKR